MKTLWSVLLAGALLCGVSVAQNRPGHFSPEAQVQALKDSLQLTSTQAEQILRIVTSASKERSALMEQHLENRDSVRALMTVIQKNTDDSVKVYLTPDQQKQYDALIRSQRTHGGRGPRPHQEDQSK